MVKIGRENPTETARCCWSDGDPYRLASTAFEPSVTVLRLTVFVISLTLVFFFVTTLIAGVYVDRWKRKKILIYSDTLQALVTLLLIYSFTVGFAELETSFVAKDPSVTIEFIALFETGCPYTITPISFSYSPSKKSCDFSV